jgi:hypothetical protein
MRGNGGEREFLIGPPGATPIKGIGANFKFPPFKKGRCEKFGIYPLTLPSPTRGEGKYIK